LILLREHFINILGISIEILNSNGQLITLVSLVEALARRFDAYIFYDDNTNTGMQALNIMAAWLNKPLPDEFALKMVGSDIIIWNRLAIH
jgi:hypothetical protein